jgi:hypothetical protein
VLLERGKKKRNHLCALLIGDEWSHVASRDHICSLRVLERGMKGVLKTQKQDSGKGKGSGIDFRRDDTGRMAGTSLAKTSRRRVLVQGGSEERLRPEEVGGWGSVCEGRARLDGVREAVGIPDLQGSGNQPNPLYQSRWEWSENCYRLYPKSK